MEKDLSKITNVLIFKDGYYWLTIFVYPGDGLDAEFDDDEDEMPIGYTIVPESWDIHNGFEFASDAYAYLSHITERENV